MSKHTAAQLLAASIVLASQFKPGDTVTLCRDIERDDNALFGIAPTAGSTGMLDVDWNNDNGNDELPTVIEAVNAQGLVKIEEADGDSYMVPWYCLRRYEEGSGVVLPAIDGDRPRVDDDGKVLIVGCKEVPFKTVEAVYKAMVAKQPTPRRAPAKKAAKKAARKVAKRPARRMPPAPVAPRM